MYKISAIFMPSRQRLLTISPYRDYVYNSVGLSEAAYRNVGIQLFSPQICSLLKTVQLLKGTEYIPDTFLQTRRDGRSFLPDEDLDPPDPAHGLYI